MSENSIGAFLWPSTNNIEQAKNASRHGFIASIFIACVSPIYTIMGMLSVGLQEHFYLAFVPTVYYVVISLLIFKMSRLAVILGLIFVLPELLASILDPGSLTVILLIITMAFVNSLRGTFKFHKLKHYSRQSVSENV